MWHQARFIRAAKRTELGAGVLGYSCHFDGARYKDDLFTQMNIPFPESLRRAVPTRRAEFLAGRFCAINALRNAGIVTNDLPIGRQRCPIWPQPAKGAITHEGEFALAAVTTDDLVLGLGIDVATILENDVRSEIENTVLCGLEPELLRATEGLEPRTALTLVFSIKESFFKAAYPAIGQYFGFDALEVTSICLTDNSVRMRLGESVRAYLPNVVLSGTFSFYDRRLGTLVTLRAA